jgi:large repetitive protein
MVRWSSWGIVVVLALLLVQQAGAQTPLFGFNEGYAQRLPDIVYAERELNAAKAALAGFDRERDGDRWQAAARQVQAATATLGEARDAESERLGSVIADSRAAGAQVARYAIPWAVVEPGPGRFNWAHYDFVYHQLLARGIRPLPILIDSPEWARPSRPRAHGTFAAWHPDRPFDHAWGRFASLVAERYPQSVAIEVWNEQNSEHFWGGTPDPRRYVELLRAAHDGIKRARPAMPVLLGGPAPRIDHRFQWDRYLRRAYGHGAALASDDLSLHPYATRRAAGAEVAQVLAQVHRAQDLVARHHRRARIWVTELGFSTHPQADRRVSELRQAELLTDVHERLSREGVRALLVHQVRDRQTGDPNEDGYGVTEVDGRRKPGFCALVVLRFANRFC